MMPASSRVSGRISHPPRKRFSRVRLSTANRVLPAVVKAAQLGSPHGQPRLAASNVFGRFTEVRRAALLAPIAVLPWPDPDRGPTACGKWCDPGDGSARAASRRLLDPDQVRPCAPCRATAGCFVLDVWFSRRSERLHGPLLIGLLPDHAAHVGDLQRAISADRPPHRSLPRRPPGHRLWLLPRRLRRSISSAGFAARLGDAIGRLQRLQRRRCGTTVLTGLFVTSDFVIMSLIPDSSTDARIAPPEADAGPWRRRLSSTLAAPFFKQICGEWWCRPSARDEMLLRRLNRLRMASGTSPAFPSPATTRRSGRRPPRAR